MSFNERWSPDFVKIIFALCIGIAAIIGFGNAVDSASKRAAATPTPLPVQANIQIQQVPNRCIAIAGDSIAYGVVLFETPSSEVYIMHFNPLSAYLKRSLADVGLSDVEVQDQSLTAIVLGTSPKGPSYFDTPFYQSLLADHCAVTIIMPWLNNLSIPNLSPEKQAEFYLAQLDTLIGNIATYNPNGKIVLLDYYVSKLQPFMTSISGGNTPENVNFFNSRIQAACKNDAVMTRVICLHTQDAFANMGDVYLLSLMTQAEIQDDLAQKETVGRAEEYFKQHPDAVLTGDGEHLSPAGKSALAKFIVVQAGNFFKPQ